MSRAKNLPKTLANPARGRSQKRSRKADFSSRQEPYYFVSALLAGQRYALQPVIGHSFVVLDDREYVTANPTFMAPAWSTIQWAFTSTELRTGIR